MAKRHELHIPFGSLEIKPVPFSEHPMAGVRVTFNLDHPHVPGMGGTIVKAARDPADQVVKPVIRLDDGRFILIRKLGEATIEGAQA